jgi:hypothetical protein
MAVALGVELSKREGLFTTGMIIKTPIIKTVIMPIK